MKETRKTWNAFCFGGAGFSIKGAKKATTYEELNANDEFVNDDLATHSKKINESKTSSLSLTKNIFNN